MSYNNLNDFTSLKQNTRQFAILAMHVHVLVLYSIGLTWVLVLHVFLERVFKLERSFTHETHRAMFGPSPDGGTVSMPTISQLGFLLGNVASSPVNTLLHRFEWVHVVSVFRVENQLRFAEEFHITNTACVNVEVVSVRRVLGIFRC